MLQSMRDNLKGTAAVIIAAFFGFILVIGGIDFFTGASGGSVDQVAEVDGEEITELELQRAIQNRRDRIESQYGEEVPADLLSDAQLREPVLRQLIDSLVVREAAKDSGMVMSAAMVDKEIVQMPAFQVNEQFDKRAFRDGLRRMGFGPIAFRQLLEQDMTLQQYAASISDSAFTTRASAEQVVAISMEERDFDYVILPVAPLLADISVDDSDVETYYQSHQKDFLQSEQVAIEYIELKPEIFARNIDIAEADVRAQYQQEVDHFEANIRRRAAHILIDGALNDASQTEQKTAEIQRKLAAGEDFSTLAKEYSDDAISSEKGGDLGFSSGDVFPEQFEEALAKLKPGEVSAPVVTDSGTHFIKLIEVTDAEPPTFEERKAAITAQLRNAAAEAEFVDAVIRLGDLAAYTATDLAEPAKELGVEVHKTPLFSRSGGPGIAANSAVIAAAFSPEVMSDGNNSDVLNLSDTDAVVLRVVEHKAAGVKPLTEVKAEIVQRLQRDKASAQLLQKAQAIQQALNEGEDFGAQAQKDHLTLEASDKTRRGGFGARGEIVAEAFKLSPPQAGQFETKLFNTTSGDQVVLQLRMVRPGSLSAQSSEQRKALMRQLSSMNGTVELAAVQQYLASKADIEIKQ